MRPSTATPTFECATCELATGGDPTFHLGLAFCWAGCAADGPCICSYDPEPIADAPAPLEPAATLDDRILVGAR